MSLLLLATDTATKECLKSSYQVEKLKDFNLPSISLPQKSNFGVGELGKVHIFQLRMRTQILAWADWPWPNHLTWEPVSWQQSLKSFLTLKFHQTAGIILLLKSYFQAVRTNTQLQGSKAASDYTDHSALSLVGFVWTWMSHNPQE